MGVSNLEQFVKMHNFIAIKSTESNFDKACALEKYVSYIER